MRQQVSLWVTRNKLPPPPTVASNQAMMTQGTTGKSGSPQWSQPQRWRWPRGRPVWAQGGEGKKRKVGGGVASWGASGGGRMEVWTLPSWRSGKVPHPRMWMKASGGGVRKSMGRWMRSRWGVYSVASWFTFFSVPLCYNVHSGTNYSKSFQGLI
jgi:hypothetical protein